MKLYDLKRFGMFTLIDVDVKTPPDANLVGVEQGYQLHNIDGMYSYCEGLTDGKVYHFAAWTEVEEYHG